MVARWAHNPEVEVFESLPRNQPEVILEIDVFHTDVELVRFRPSGLSTEQTDGSSSPKVTQHE